MPISQPSPVPSNPPPSSSTEVPPPPEAHKPEEPKLVEYKPDEPRPVVFKPREPEPVEYIPEEPEAIIPDNNSIIPPSNEDSNVERESPKPVDYVPEVPRYYAPLYTSPEPSPNPESSTSREITYSEPRETPNRPDIVYEPNSEPPRRKETPDSTYYETRPDKTVSSNEIIPEVQERPSERLVYKLNHNSL